MNFNNTAKFVFSIVLFTQASTCLAPKGNLTPNNGALTVFRREPLKCPPVQEFLQYLFSHKDHLQDADPQVLTRFCERLKGFWLNHPKGKISSQELTKFLRQVASVIPKITLAIQPLEDNFPEAAERVSSQLVVALINGVEETESYPLFLAAKQLQYDPTRLQFLKVVEVLKGCSWIKGFLPESCQAKTYHVTSNRPWSILILEVFNSETNVFESLFTFTIDLPAKKIHILELHFDKQPKKFNFNDLIALAGDYGTCTQLENSKEPGYTVQRFLYLGDFLALLFENDATRKPYTYVCDIRPESFSQAISSRHFPLDIPQEILVADVSFNLGTLNGTYKIDDNSFVNLFNCPCAIVGYIHENKSTHRYFIVAERDIIIECDAEREKEASLHEVFPL